MLNLVSKAIKATAQSVAKGLKVSALSLVVTLPAGSKALAAATSPIKGLMPTIAIRQVVSTSAGAVSNVADLSTFTFGGAGEAVHSLIAKQMMFAAKTAGVDKYTMGYVQAGGGGLAHQQMMNAQVNTANMNAVVAARIAALQAQNNN